MATILLGAAGSAIGSTLGGSILGVSAATIGQTVGGAVGAFVDRAITQALQPKQVQRGPAIDQIGLAAPREGQPLARVKGWARVQGRVIWPTEPIFRVEVTRQQTGGKGLGGGGTTTETQAAFVDLAMAICEGPIDMIRKVWADGNLYDLSRVSHEIYYGGDTQDPDPTMEAVEGAGNVPHYRGIAYLVLTGLPVAEFGNRIPQFHFEVYRGPDAAAVPIGAHRGFNIIPGSAEYAYDPLVVRKAETDSTGAVLRSSVENSFLTGSVSDFTHAIDHLQAEHRALEQVSLVIAWFGTDLRAGECRVEPRVDLATKSIDATYAWRVSGLTRAGATVVSESGGFPAYGGAPNDASVIRAIRDLTARGFRVTIHPFILMDVPAGNALPSPYGGASQPAYPWRGRITCDPAPDQPGTADKTAAVATQLDAFFGAATAGEYTAGGDVVTYGGADGFTVSRFILHCAWLAEQAGGVDSFLLGSEMRGVTRLRDDTGAFPAIGHYRRIAGEVRSILGAGCRISYGADWTEYGAYAPGDGTGDVLFPLDDLWADAEIDFVGIDAYFPLTDWRDAPGEADAALASSIYDRSYIRAGIEGGEAYDYFYASEADRTAQNRTPIDDTAHGEDWVFRAKDLRQWHASAHHPRPGGVRSATPSAWVPGAKPIVFTEYGVPAVDKGTNEPNVFVDPKSSETQLPHFSSGARDDDLQRIASEEWVAYWLDASFIDSARCCAWAWDARPWPAFARTDIWADAENYPTGHWVNGRPSVTLERMIIEEAAYHGVSALVDPGALLGGVEGVSWEQLGSFRDAVEPYANAFFADFVGDGAAIRVTSRGVEYASTAPALADLALPSTGRRVSRTHAPVSAVPERAQISARDAVQDYDTDTQPAESGLAGAEGDLSFDLPATLDPQLLAPLARAALADAAAAREAVRFRLPRTWLLSTAPGTVFAADLGAGLETLVITARNIGDDLAIEARRFDPAVRAPLRQQRLAVRANVLASPSDVIPVFLDLPQLVEGQTPTIGFVAVHADPFQTMRLERSAQADTGFAAIATLPQRAVIGELAGALPAGQAAFWQRASVEVDLFTGSIVTRSDTDVLGGANTLAIQTATGWEIVSFAEAELVDTRRWRLSRLLRGVRGTAPISGLAPGIAAGARVVLLDAALGSAEILSGDVDVPYFWAVGPDALDRADPSWTTTEHTFTGRGQQPFPPAHLEVRRQGGDLVASWIRQDKDPAADVWQGEVPMTEADLRFRVEIVDGGALLFAKEVTAETATITAAEEASSGATLPWTLRVAQVSQAAGVGPRSTIEVTA